MSIDIVKAMLVIQMISSHTIDFLAKSYHSLYSEYVNATTFPIFFFIFGCNIWIAYLRKEKEEISSRLIRNIIRLLIAFYVSGITERIIVEHDYSISTVFKIIFFSEIPGYSEFLVAFLLCFVIVYLFFNQIKQIVESRMFVFFVVVLSLLSTFVPYHNIKPIQLELFMGGYDAFLFPLFQYFSFFILGVYLQKNKLFDKRMVWVFSGFLTFISLIYIYIYNCIPTRFPPSFFYISFAFLPALAYKKIAKIVSKFIPLNSHIQHFFEIWGRYTLDYLLISNVLLFSLSNFFPNCSLVLGFTFYLMIIGICYMYGEICYKMSKSKI